MKDKYVTIFCLRMRYGDIINYSYIIEDNYTRNAIIIDPSWELDKILKIVNEENITLQKILLTHEHYDHVNLVDDLVSLFDIDVYCGEYEKGIYKYLFHGVNFLSETNKVIVDNINVQCIHTPGHTQGSLCFYVNKKYIFTGDTLFIEGCGDIDTYSDSATDMYYSITKLIGILPEDVIVLPGHAYKAYPGKTIRFLMKNNIYLNILDKGDFTSFLTRKKKRRPFI